MPKPQSHVLDVNGTYLSYNFCRPPVEVPHHHTHNNWSRYECEGTYYVSEGNNESVIIPSPVLAISPQVEGHPSKGQQG